MSVTILARLALIAALAGLLAGSPARADMLVLESTVAQYKVGDRLADTTTMAVPDGQHVKVLLLPSNTTKVFDGKAASGVGALPFGGMRGLKRKPPAPQ